MSLLRKAQRKQAKLKIGVFGPSGSGKTYSSLLVAKGLVDDWSKIVVIDTENNSADLYSDLGEYNVIPLDPPYSPDNYIKAIDACVEANMECIIIDSLSHSWSGEGGAIDTQSKLGGRFQDWAKVKPMYRKMLGKILNTPIHFILTSRVKTDWVIDENEKGRKAPKKAGLKADSESNIEYELTTVFRLDHSHLSECDKDRTGLFMDRSPFILNQDIGKEFKTWSTSGVEVWNFKNESDVSSFRELLESKNIPREKWQDLGKSYNGLPKTEELSL